MEKQALRSELTRTTIFRLRQPLSFEHEGALCDALLDGAFSKTIQFTVCSDLNGKEIGDQFTVCSDLNGREIGDREYP
eukprot:4192456-Pyramimonas_sp.AAC.1